LAAMGAKGGTLRGNPPDLINAFTWTISGLFTGLVVLAVAYSVSQRFRKIVDARLSKATNRQLVLSSWTPAMVPAAFLCSYSLLVPGLVATLFSYKVSAMDGEVEMFDETESMLDFIRTLAEQGSWLGAILVVLYAMVIPAAKLVLLALAGFWRRGTPTQVMRARLCVRALQAISKWAAPDMFAYVLLLFLLRSLDHPPLLEAVVRMDIGFSCFAVFCVSSTVAALGVEMPPLPEGVEATTRSCGGARSRGAQACVVAALVAAFVPLLAAGLTLPSMSLRIDLGSVEALADALHLEDLARADVSLWRCMGTLAQWTATGEATSCIGFFLFAGCVIASTCADMLALLVAAVQIWRGGANRGGARSAVYEAVSATSRVAEPILPVRIAKVLNKLTFIDVSVAGIVVVVLSGQAYREKGIYLHLERGLLFLIAAECCHYAAYYLVTEVMHVEVKAAATRALVEVDLVASPRHSPRDRYASPQHSPQHSLRDTSPQEVNICVCIQEGVGGRRGLKPPFGGG